MLSLKIIVSYLLIVRSEVLIMIIFFVILLLENLDAESFRELEILGHLLLNSLGPL